VVLVLVDGKETEAADSRRPSLIGVRMLAAGPRREQSQAEEIANSISHGIGLVAALVGTPFLTSLMRHSRERVHSSLARASFLRPSFFFTLPLLFTMRYQSAKPSAFFGLLSIPQFFFLSLVRIRRLLLEYCVAHGAGLFLGLFGGLPSLEWR
jgi:hypothetical protein